MTHNILVTSAKCFITIDSKSKTLMLSQQTNDKVDTLSFTLHEVYGLINHLQDAKITLIDLIKG